MPGGGAFDAEPIGLAAVIDIAQVGNLRMAGITVIDQRVRPRLAKPAAERGEFRRTKDLLAEHQDRVLGESALDPGEGRVVELCQINAKRLGAEGLTKRPQSW